ncbi:MAG: sigma-70 family RNA polymerase sigma factor [Clostridiales bacterium]|nr:sigma-70 family RNA polymerase sigma factor [Clostridiales bacterium]
MIDAHQGSLLRLCYLYLRDLGLAEDAVQETFVKAWRGLEGFRGDSSEKTWLTRIAIRTCCDIRRGGWLRHVDRRILPEDLPQAAVPVRDDDRNLTAAVMNLPEKLRQAVILYYYQELNVNEIGAILGISQPSVSNRLKRAREKLRAQLEGRDLE